MSKISNEVVSNLGSAIQEIQDKLSNEFSLKTIEDNSLFESIIAETKERPKARNHNEFCEFELELAAKKGLPDPSFDFRDFYGKGETVYYVNYSEKLGEKEIHKVTLRTIYPRIMIGSEEKSYCHCIDFNQRDCVFRSSKDANDYYKSLDIAPKYTPQEPKLEEDEDEAKDVSIKNKIPDMN